MQVEDADALYRRALISCKEGRFADGVALARQALALAPRARTQVLLGRALLELGDGQQALSYLDQAIAIEPSLADAHGNRGDVLAALGRLPEAIESYRRALALGPEEVANWCNLGAAQAGLGRIADALASFERALALSPDHVLALVAHGDILRALDRPADALASYQRALAAAPKQFAALLGRAAALAALERPGEALESLDAALATRPVDADALSNRGYLLRALGRHDEGLASLARALAIDANHAEALVNRGVLLSDLDRHAEAIASYDRALANAPAHIGAHCNRSKALFALNRYDEALAGIERALAIAPDHIEALYTRGNTLSRLRRYDEAIAVFERVLELDPRHPHAHAQLAACCLWICDWDKLSKVAGELEQAMAAGTAVVSPHILLQLPMSAATARDATQRYLAREVPPGPRLDVARAAVGGGKVRVAYLSGDFRVHPVAYLTAELFERHDRSRFEWIGVSFGPDDRSELRARIGRSFDRFHDVRLASDRDVAALLAQLGVDIAVDLSGHTDNARPGILQYRPAPVQASYLGFAGTMGADFIDYIIADKVVLPFEQQPFYTEKIIHLPDCFLANDATRPIAPDTPARASVGLPEHGLVFCCFNNSYKISADVFRAWLRLLQRVPASVLWLSQPPPSAAENLRAAARAGGIDPGRIVFAPRMPSMADHLARHRLADLFLDTPGYNAHTTASDALWAGLPVITCIGTRFAGRVAASLLHAVGLPELVTATVADYQALALKLADDAELRAAVRRKLAQNRLTYPLFDTDRFRRHIEQAYLTMWDSARQGHAPRSFSVEPSEL